MTKRKKPRPAATQFARPNEHRETHNEFRHAGAAVRVVPVIETLAQAKRITAAEFAALERYRDIATRAEDDLRQAGTIAPERMMGGSNGSPASRVPASLLMPSRAAAELRVLDARLGHLQPLVRAIAVDDLTPSALCMAATGTRERRDGDRVRYEPHGRACVGDTIGRLKAAAKLLH